MAERRILFLYETDAPFVAADRAILSDHFEVEPLDWSHQRPTGLLGRLRRADLTFSWFALGYAARAVLFGRLFGRPSVVVAGGWDVIDMPDIAYGAAQGWRGRTRARVALRHADRVLAISAWSQGAIRNLSGRTSDLVYPGVDVDRFAPRGAREDLVVTVGNVTRGNLARKGLETFVRAAALLPDTPFVLAGRHVDDAAHRLRAIATPNVEMPGWLPEDALRELLAKAKVYVQVSRNEGFGLALAEAMAAGCVPVTTREGAMPEVVGDVGFLAPLGDVAGTATAIQAALASNRGSAARARIVTHFPLAGRRKRLLAIVEGLLRR